MKNRTKHTDTINTIDGHFVDLENKLKNHKYWKKEVVPKRNNLFQHFIQYSVLSLIDGFLVVSIRLYR